MAYDAFISYRHADGDAARGVCKLLRAFSLSVYIDEGIAAGAAWAPEIWQALEVSRSLMVLWSRSAEKSSYVRDEWRNAPAGCRIIALKLDGAALPPSLAPFNAITGLDVAGRLVARSVELMKERRLNPSEAQAQLLAELASDGIVLEEKQKQALAGLLPALAIVPWWLSSSVATAALMLLSGAGAFGVGFWVAPRADAAPFDVTVNSATPAPSARVQTTALPTAVPPCASGQSVSAPNAGERGAPTCQNMYDRRGITSEPLAAQRRGRAPKPTL